MSNLFLRYLQPPSRASDILMMARSKSNAVPIIERIRANNKSLDTHLIQATEVFRRLVVGISNPVH